MAERSFKRTRAATVCGIVGFLTLAVTSAPAHAEIDPPRPKPQGPRDGVWVQATVVKPLKDGAIAIQYGDLGGTDIRYIAVQGERRLRLGFALGVAYGYGELAIERAPDLPLHLARLFTTWAGRSGAVELDGRLWADVLIPERGATRYQLRARGRVALPLGRSRSHPAVFIADEVFLEEGRGLIRNRVTGGLRLRPGGGPLGIELYWQHSDDRGGGNQDVAGLSATWALPK